MRAGSRFRFDSDSRCIETRCSSPVRNSDSTVASGSASSFFSSTTSRPPTVKLRPSTRSARAFISISRPASSSLLAERLGAQVLALVALQEVQRVLQERRVAALCVEQRLALGRRSGPAKASSMQTPMRSPPAARPARRDSGARRPGCSAPSSGPARRRTGSRGCAGPASPPAPTWPLPPRVNTIAYSLQASLNSTPARYERIGLAREAEAGAGPDAAVAVLVAVAAAPAFRSRATASCCVLPIRPRPAPARPCRPAPCRCAGRPGPPPRTASRRTRCARPRPGRWPDTAISRPATVL